MSIIITLVCIIAVGAYMFPTILSFITKTPHKGTIFVLNFFLGWSVIGYAAALFLCFYKEPIWNH